MATLPASPAPFDILSAITIGGVKFGANALASIVVTALICAALYVFFRYTRYGLAMRATAIDQEAALAIGINISTVYALAWGIAGAIATIGGVFLAAGAGNPAFDVGLGQAALVAFPAIILGGLDSIPRRGGRWHHHRPGLRADAGLRAPCGVLGTTST